jgi:hypothetical protein
VCICLLPSSLDSLASGWRAVGSGEVLGSCAGILAPPHDGDFPGFTGYARAAFDEAEPMAVQNQKVKQAFRSESEGVVEFNLWE